MSDRMHEIQQEFPEIELIHRSFALGGPQTILKQCLAHERQ